MPNPAPLRVAATVTSEDVRRAYYETAPWSVWICEMQLDPLQLITRDDNTGKYARVPITINGDEFEFGEAVPVEIQYVDTTGTPAAASAGRLVYASRAESRPGARPPRADLPTPPVEPAAGPTPPDEGAASMALDEGLRQRLGLDADADEATILAALDEALDERADPAPTDPAPAPDPAAVGASLPAGTVLVDEATWRQVQEQAQQGVAARAQQLTEARDRAISDAIAAGKIPPARRAHFEQSWAADPDGTAQTLASLAPGLVPLEDIGEPGTEDGADLDAEFDRLHSRKGA